MHKHWTKTAICIMYIKRNMAELGMYGIKIPADYW